MAESTHLKPIRVLETQLPCTKFTCNLFTSNWSQQKAIKLSFVGK